MGKTSKLANQIKYGLTGSKKKFGINYWRFFFNALNTTTAAEQMFYVEFEMLNPWISPEKAVLGYKSRVFVKAEDLQYALAGTQSATSLKTETIVQPSYCVVRIGKFGKDGKQLCKYFPVKDAEFGNKNFEIKIDQFLFSENALQGFISISQEELTAAPELLCDSGIAKWDISYVINKSIGNGFNSSGYRWFPAGLNTTFKGSLVFDGEEYKIEPVRSYGSMERYWGKSLMEPWFHISSSNLVSNITGKTLFGASFNVQGVSDGHVSFTGNIDDTEIVFSTDSSNKYQDLWQCTQMPEVEELEENRLHWSVSIHNKAWIIDIDVYCKINELCNRNIELPEGQRKVLNVLEGGSGFGEIKIYKRRKNDLEQIEFAKISNCICEFGHIEDSEL